MDNVKAIEIGHTQQKPHHLFLTLLFVFHLLYTHFLDKSAFLRYFEFHQMRSHKLFPINSIFKAIRKTQKLISQNSTFQSKETK